MLSEIEGGYDFDTGTGTQKGLETDHEYKIWNFAVRWDYIPGENKHSNFSLEMSIRITPVDDKTDYDKIIRKDYN